MSQVGDVMRIPADTARLASVRAFVRDRASSSGADPRAVQDLVQAVDESVTNVIEHGYRGGKGAIEIELDSRGGSIIVTLRDQARPFDPTRVPDPDTTASLERRAARGMGIFLARELTDSMTYQRTQAGNELRLIKAATGSEGG